MPAAARAPSASPPLLLLLLLLALTCAALLLPAARAQTHLRCSARGDVCFQIVLGGVSNFAAAQAAAAVLTLNGTAGELASIRDTAEMAVLNQVLSAFVADEQFILGGQTAADGTWRWTQDSWDINVPFYPFAACASPFNYWRNGAPTSSALNRMTTMRSFFTSTWGLHDVADSTPATGFIAKWTFPVYFGPTVGSDALGDGTAGQPYATLDKVLSEGALRIQIFNNEVVAPPSAPLATSLSSVEIRGPGTILCSGGAGVALAASTSRRALILRDLTIRNCNARALLIDTLTEGFLRDVTVRANSVTGGGDGGGAYIDDKGGPFGVCRSRFFANSALTGLASGGGAALRGSVRVHASEFVHNSAAGDGGGLSAAGSVYATDLQVHNNTAGRHGGGASFDGAAQLVASSVFANWANTGGGSLKLDGTSVATLVTVNGSSAAQFGGCVYVVGTGTLTQSTVTRCITTTAGTSAYGGCVALAGSGSLALSVVSLCYSPGRGGCVSAASSASISLAAISSCRAVTIGGGVELSGAASFTAGSVSTATVVGPGNTGDGGCLYAAGTASVTGVDFSTCYAENFGGGVYATGTVVVSLCSFVTCTSWDGGGIYLLSSAVAHSNKLTGSYVYNDGGAIWAGGASRAANNSALTSTCEHDGGALYGTGTALLFANTVVDGSTFGAGGNNGAGIALNDHAVADSNAVSIAVGVYGGCMSLIQTAVAVNNTLRSCSSSQRGGGLYVDTSSFAALNSVTTSVSGDGGCVFVRQSGVVANSTLRSCLASTNGGGISASNGARLFGNSMATCTSLSRGGCLSLADSSRAEQSVMTACTSTSTGGCMYLKNTAVAVNSTASHCLSALGGGAYVTDSAQLLASSIAWASVTNSAGGWFCDQTARISDSLATHCTAWGGAGGGAYSLGSCALTSNTYAGNAANAVGGGGAYLLASAQSVNETFVDNYALCASCAGGGLNVLNSVSVTGALVRNNSAASAGGLQVANVARVSGCRIEDNVATTSHGGGVVASGAAFLSALAVRRNRANANGGGVRLDGSVALRDSDVADNVAGGEGGGVDADGQVALINNTYAGNLALADGGGLRLRSALNLTSQTVRNNTALAKGGGVRATDTVSLVDVRLFNNTAWGDGGGAHLGDSSRLVASEASDGVAGRDGGGVFAQDAAQVTACSVHGNLAFSTGGGVFVRDAALVASACALTDNRAFGSGGGAYLRDTAALLNASILRNAAAGDGGGARVSQTARLADCLVQNNSADSSGGGVHVSDTATLHRTLVFGNVATANGGGVAYGSLAEPLGADVTVVNNTAHMSGGGVFLSGSALLSNATVRYNSVTSVPGLGALGGGGVSATDSARVENCTVEWNEAEGTLGGGGVLLRSAATLDASLSSVRFNTAWTSGGGGVAAWHTSTVLLLNAALFPWLSLASPSSIEFNLAFGTTGGGVSAHDSAVVLSGRVSHNVAANGGGVALAGGALARDVLVDANSVSNFGGGIVLSASSLAVNCSAVNNSAGFRGGGVALLNDARATLLFLSLNVATVGGGASLQGTAQLNDSRVTLNGAALGGGVAVTALSALGSTVVESNVASVYGGGVLASVSAVARLLVVRNNTVTAGSGGGVSVHDSATLSDSLVELNSASEHAGGVLLLNGSLVRGVAVRNNVALVSSGGARVDDTALLDQSSVTGNRALGAAGGGGLTVLGSGAASNTTVRDNAAPVGPAGGVLATASASLSLLTVVNNTAGGGGGGVLLAGAAVLRGGVIANNSATASGGGLNAMGDSAAALCDIRGNVAVVSGTGSVAIVPGGGGGAALFEGARLSSSSLVGNSLGAGAVGAGLLAVGTLGTAQQTVVAENLTIVGNVLPAFAVAGAWLRGARAVLNGSSVVRDHVATLAYRSACAAGVMAELGARVADVESAHNRGLCGMADVWPFGAGAGMVLLNDSVAQRVLVHSNDAPNAAAAGVVARDSASLTDAVVLNNTCGRFACGAALHDHASGAGLVVRGHRSYIAGGLLLAGYARVDGALVQNNTAETAAAGGVLCVEHAQLHNATIADNVLGVGAASLSASGQCSLTPVDLLASSGGGGGAGLFAQDSARVANVTLRNNAARATDSCGGGAAAVGGASLCGLLAANNSAMFGDGGGVALADSVACSSGVQLAFNDAGRSGGGAVLHDSASLADATLDGNVAWSLNGGAALLRDSASATGVTATDNVAMLGAGGGIMLRNSAALANATLVRNVAALSGGGGVAAVDLASLRNVTAVANSAPNNYAGGVALLGQARGSGLTVVGNVALEVGGLVIGDSAAASDLHCEANVATGASGIGGGCGLLYGTAQLTGATVVGNVAHASFAAASPSGGGGGLVLLGTSVARDLVLADNVASQGCGGGAVLLDASLLDGVRGSRNVAMHGSGGGVLVTADAHLRNATLDSCWAGVIASLPAPATLAGLTPGSFSDYGTRGGAGAVHALGASARLTDVHARNSTAFGDASLAGAGSGHGGAFLLQLSASAVGLSADDALAVLGHGGCVGLTDSATLANGTFSSCLAVVGSGGGVRAADSAVVADVFVQHARALVGTGGGVAGADQTRLVNITTFNTSAALGGGIRLGVDCSASGLRVSRASASTFGGCMLLSGQSSATDVDARDCTSADIAGCVWMSTATSLSQATFTGCSAAADGGGVSMFQQARATNVTLRNCTSGNNGGCAWLTDTARLSNGSLSECRALLGDGGGLWLGSAAAVDSVAIASASTAAGDGGGVWMTDVSTATNISVTGATASGNGGGVLAMGAASSLSAKLESCMAQRSGGGVYAQNNASLVGVLLAACTALIDGGGASLADNATLARVAAQHNVAHGAPGGGGVVLRGSSRLLDAVFVGDRAAAATACGGAVLALNTSSIARVNVSAASAGMCGGGIALRNAATARDVVVLGSGSLSTADTAGGGGMYVTDAGVVANAVVQACVSAAHGGGVLIEGTASLVNALATSNTAGACGQDVAANLLATLSGVTVTADVDFALTVSHLPGLLFLCAPSSSSESVDVVLGRSFQSLFDVSTFQYPLSGGALSLSSVFQDDVTLTPRDLSVSSWLGYDARSLRLFGLPWRLEHTGVTIVTVTATTASGLTATYTLSISVLPVDLRFRFVSFTRLAQDVAPASGSAAALSVVGDAAEASRASRRASERAAPADDAPRRAASTRATVSTTSPTSLIVSDIALLDDVHALLLLHAASGSAGADRAFVRVVAVNRTRSGVGVDADGNEPLAAAGASDLLQLSGAITRVLRLSATRVACIANGTAAAFVDVWSAGGLVYDNATAAAVAASARVGHAAGALSSSTCSVVVGSGAGANESAWAASAPDVTHCLGLSARVAQFGAAVLDAATMSAADSGEQLVVTTADAQLHVLQVDAATGAFNETLRDSGGANATRVLLTPQLIVAHLVTGVLAIMPNVALAGARSAVTSNMSLFLDIVGLGSAGSSLFVVDTAYGIARVNVSEPAAPALSALTPSVGVADGAVGAFGALFLSVPNSGLLLLSTAQSLETPASAAAAAAATQLDALSSVPRSHRLSMLGVRAAGMVLPGQGSGAWLVEVETTINRAPRLTSAASDPLATEALIGTAFVYTPPPALFYDPDGDALNWTVLGIRRRAPPAWLSIDALSGALSGVVPATLVADTQLALVLWVTDRLGASTTCGLTVTLRAAGIVSLNSISIANVRVGEVWSAAYVVSSYFSRTDTALSVPMSFDLAAPTASSWLALDTSLTLLDNSTFTLRITAPPQSAATRLAHVATLRALDPGSGKTATAAIRVSVVRSLSASVLPLRSYTEDTPLALAGMLSAATTAAWLRASVTLAPASAGVLVLSEGVRRRRSDDEGAVVGVGGLEGAVMGVGGLEGAADAAPSSTSPPPSAAPSSTSPPPSAAPSSTSPPPSAAPSSTNPPPSAARATGTTFSLQGTNAEVGAWLAALSFEPAANSYAGATLAWSVVDEFDSVGTSATTLLVGISQNDPPAVSELAPSAWLVLVGDESVLAFAPFVSDTDDTELLYDLVEIDADTGATSSLSLAWLAIDSGTGALTARPGYADIGEYDVWLRVLDQRGASATTELFITVANKPLRFYVLILLALLGVLLLGMTVHWAVRRNMRRELRASLRKCFGLRPLRDDDQPPPPPPPRGRCCCCCCCCCCCRRGVLVGADHVKLVAITGSSSSTAQLGDGELGSASRRSSGVSWDDELDVGDAPRGWLSAAAALPRPGAKTALPMRFGAADGDAHDVAPVAAAPLVEPLRAAVRERVVALTSGRATSDEFTAGSVAPLPGVGALSPRSTLFSESLLARRTRLPSLLVRTAASARPSSSTPASATPSAPSVAEEP